MTKKIRIRESIEILKESADIYQIVITSKRKLMRYRVDKLVREIISQLLIERNYFELIDELSKIFILDDVVKCLYSLEKCGIVRIRDDITVSKISVNQVNFIDEFTSSWDETLKAQKTLENTTIVVFGVGGIGSWIVNGLSQMNIGQIRIVDPDVVEIENLNRQLFLSPSDVGKLKIDVIAQKCFGQIKKYNRSINTNVNLDDIIVDSNFLINCTDNPSVAYTTKIIEEYAIKYAIPFMVSGGYNLHKGLIGSIFIPGVTKSFDDYIRFQDTDSTLKNQKLIKSVEQSGNLGPLAGAVANIHLMEIFKHITKIGSVNYNKIAELDFLTMNLEWKEF